MRGDTWERKPVFVARYVIELLVGYTKDDQEVVVLTVVTALLRVSMLVVKTGVQVLDVFQLQVLLVVEL